MAALSLILEFDVVVRGEADTAARIRAALLDEGGGWWDRRRYELASTVRERDGEIAVRLDFSAELSDDRPETAGSGLGRFAEGFQRAVRGQTVQWHYGALEPLGEALGSASPGATIAVPLLAGDRGLLANDDAASRTVEAAVRELYAFWSDQDERLRAVQVRLHEDTLVISGPSPSAAADVAAAYLRAVRRQSAPWQALSPRPVWALASALMALLSFALSWLPLTWASVALLGVLELAIAVAALLVFERLPSRRAVTAWGLAPIVVLLVFACTYGAIALAAPAAITLGVAPMHHLRDPLLLSLSLLTTVGVLDLQVHRWVRSLAYLEMLLIAGLAGGAAIVAARRLSRRVESIVDELRADRG